MKISELAPAKGSKKRRVRRGRGEGSTLGKTSGRGGKGQTARTGGGVRHGFEGGQMPLYRRLPKLGFRSRMRRFGVNKYTVINLADLESFSDGATVSPETLGEAGIRLKSGDKAGVKLLAGGKLTKKVNVTVSAISEAARRHVEKLGGSVTILEKKTTAKDPQASK